MNQRTENQTTFSGWQGTGLIAITYIYFLIFAEFGFLKRLADLGIGGDQLKTIMGVMATGGIAASLLGPRLENFTAPALRMQLAFAGCAAGAVFSLLPMDLAAALAVSFLIGSALGVLTVTLVTHLKSWMGQNRPLLQVGLGVGLAYFVCNYPALFESSPAVMAVVSAVLCVAGIVISTFTADESATRLASGKSTPFLLALGCFTALVWLDSAAFFMIQNTPELKSGTWEGARRLWQNGGVHLVAAIASALLLQSRGLSTTLTIAFTFLGGACLLLAEPSRAVLASVAYPAGVSLYSVALVAYPAFLANKTSTKERALLAGWLYAVAGWIGSGLGIGMGENLRHIPPLFVLVAALLFFAPVLWTFFRQRQREILATVVFFGTAWILFKWMPPSTKAEAQMSLIEKGRKVYVAEGCIHCHSQFVRPGSTDEIMWGTATDVDESRAEQPPLIGNRRQGPDLSSVGNRRSPLWLKAHFVSPAAVSQRSPMPSYAHLFADERGEALLAYVESLGSTNLETRLTTQSGWHVSNRVTGNPLDGSKLVKEYCITCHSPAGATRKAWGQDFKRLPPDFSTGPFAYAPATAEVEWRRKRIAQIIKFGLPGTDMPGHEYLPDNEIASMADYIVRLARTKQP